jgi:hypothetical protein
MSSNSGKSTMVITFLVRSCVPCMRGRTSVYIRLAFCHAERVHIALRNHGHLLG